ncbi:MAG: glycosyltransferase family 2 protein [Legionella sp.]
MINNKKIVVVLPAYNAEKTLGKTYNDIPFDIVDEVIFVDDCSQDKSVSVAQKLGIKHIIQHDKNKGYGGNQKTCYTKALELNADVVIMLHPDYQYTPKLITPMSHIICSGLYPVVLGSRILGNGALEGGMPLIKYVANRILTFIQNILVGQKLGEYHTGYRAFSKEVLQNIDFKNNSDDFIFDNQMLAQIIYKKYPIAEITCPTKYFKEASSISLIRSATYGLGVLKVSVVFFLNRIGLLHSKLFE